MSSFWPSSQTRIVAIVGRPNVGKSTLFNRLVGERAAIVQESPGVTRDRLYRPVIWNGREFLLVDTGGIPPVHEPPAKPFPADARVPGEESLASPLLLQTQKAVQEANLILFLTDVKEGISSAEWEIAQMLRRERKPVILAVNKVDSQRDLGGLYDFFSLGLGDPFPLSAMHGLNIGDLLDRIVETLWGDQPDTVALPGDKTDSLIQPPGEAIRGTLEKQIQVVILGRPNVGKSSLLNAILGEERVVVDSRPGTTRDAIHTFCRVESEGSGSPLEGLPQPQSVSREPGNLYCFIDTAGMRRRSPAGAPAGGKKLDSGSAIELDSVSRALKSLGDAHLALLVLEAPVGVLHQDRHLAGEVLKKGKGLILVVNKWDLVPQRSEEFLKYLRRELHFIQFAPVLFTSASTGEGIQTIFPAVNEVFHEYTRRIETSLVNRVVQEAQSLPPPSKGKHFRIFFAFQARTAPPTFVLMVNHPSLFSPSHGRYLEARFRQAFGFTGVPVGFLVRKKK